MNEKTQVYQTLLFGSVGQLFDSSFRYRILKTEPQLAILISVDLLFVVFAQLGLRFTWILQTFYRDFLFCALSTFSCGGNVFLVQVCDRVLKAELMFCRFATVPLLQVVYFSTYGAPSYLISAEVERRTFFVYHLNLLAVRHFFDRFFWI